MNKAMFLFVVLLQLILSLSLIANLKTIAADEWTIKTIAGTGKPGFSGDGLNALDAELNNPFGVVRGPDNCIWFCEYSGQRIRRILADGTIETIAGNGNQGYAGDGGPALAASFNMPHEIRFDTAGDLYVVDMMNHAIRKIDMKTRFVSTFAGTGSMGYSGDGGLATKAQFNKPHSIQFGPDGYLYVCDIGNHVVRRINMSTKEITTFAGTGKPGQTLDGDPVVGTPLNGPRSIDFDQDGNLWLATREGNQVFKIDWKQQRYVHIAGTGKSGFTGNGGPAKVALLSGPKGIAVDLEGNVWLADTESHSVRMINTKTGTLELIAGTGSPGDGQDGDPLKCELARLHGVFADQDGWVLIGDSEAHKIRVLRKKVAPEVTQQKYFDVYFVDNNVQPLQVTIDERSAEPNANSAYVPQYRESGANGFIRIEKRDTDIDSCCFVFAKGFAIDLLSRSTSRSRKLQVKMHPEDDIQVEVVDVGGKPISNARVSLGTVHFAESAWIANAPYRLPDQFESRTDATGRAMLHGVLAKDLESVRVSLDEGRGCTFLIPESWEWEPNNILRIVWNPTFGTLRCRVVDEEGEPVAGAKLFASTNDEVVNANVIREPTLEFNEYLGATEKDGSLTVNNIPLVPIQVRYFNPENSIGRGELRRDILVVKDHLNEVVFRQKPVVTTLVSIIDHSGVYDHSGVQIRFFLNDRFDYVSGVATANEDGIGEVPVQAGEWNFSIEESGLPDGYCVYFPDRSSTVIVKENESDVSVPPLHIGRGWQIHGRIEGVDLATVRQDSMSVEQKETGASWAGHWNVDGTFSLTVPEYLTMESIEGFQIVAAVERKRGELKIESKEPLILRWVNKQPQ